MRDATAAPFVFFMRAQAVELHEHAKAPVVEPRRARRTRAQSLDRSLRNERDRMHVDGIAESIDCDEAHRPADELRERRRPRPERETARNGAPVEIRRNGIARSPYAIDIGPAGYAQNEPFVARIVFGADLHEPPLFLAVKEQPVAIDEIEAAIAPRRRR